MFPEQIIRPLNKFASMSLSSLVEELANLAEEEDWDYKFSNSSISKPVLFNYIHYTFNRLEEEDKVAVSDDKNYASFNSGLVTKLQEPIFVLFSKNTSSEHNRNWTFCKFCRKGEHDMNRFHPLPQLAHYVDDPSGLVFDTRVELRPNVEHIIRDNKDRFPEPFRNMDDHVVQTVLKGAIENAQERVRRNYKAAIPQYHKGRVQLLLPLCLSNAQRADLAMVVERSMNSYRASTCLTLDMAYNNARLLARPDRDWLQP